MKQCPICFGDLETREVAPCYMCGSLAVELDHLRENRHSYAVYRFPNGTEMELCEVCFLDVGSIHGEHWGLAPPLRITTDDLVLVRQDFRPAATRDKYCPNCCARLAYLKSLREILDTNSQGG
ncbi:MAG: hypothetical protein KDB14_14730 [Planctomycetales bacterium]|nr:hypothetical protein [Planctomycetales bacterium]